VRVIGNDGEYNRVYSKDEICGKAYIDEDHILKDKIKLIESTGA